jgi:hypothetical protein
VSLQISVPHESLISSVVIFDYLLVVTEDIKINASRDSVTRNVCQIGTVGTWIRPLSGGKSEFYKTSNMAP